MASNLKVRLFKFGQPSKYEKKVIDRESFENIINNPNWRSRLEDGKLLGCLTHRPRQFEKQRYTKIPYEDLILTDPNVCNILRDVRVENDQPIAEFDLLSNNSANLVKDLLKKKVKLNMSMATRCKTSKRDKYYLTDIMGVDFTMKPDLDAEVLETNFSEGDGEEEYVQFSGELEIINSEDEDLIKEGFFCIPNNIEPIEFSNELEEFIENEELDLQFFNLRDYVIEMTRPPHLVIRNRLLQIVRYMQSTPQAKLDIVKPHIITYLETYIYSWIVKTLNEKDVQFNLILTLRLNNYVKDRVIIRNLQRTLNIAKRQLAAQGAMTKNIQEQVNQQFQSMMSQIWAYVNAQTSKSGKII